MLKENLKSKAMDRSKAITVNPTDTRKKTIDPNHGQIKPSFTCVHTQTESVGVSL